MSLGLNIGVLYPSCRDVVTGNYPTAGDVVEKSDDDSATVEDLDTVEDSDTAEDSDTVEDSDTSEDDTSGTSKRGIIGRIIGGLLCGAGMTGLFIREKTGNSDTEE